VLDEYVCCHVCINHRRGEDVAGTAAARCSASP